MRFYEYIILLCADNKYKGKILCKNDSSQLEKKIKIEFSSHSYNDELNFPKNSDALADCTNEMFSCLISGDEVIFSSTYIEQKASTKGSTQKCINKCSTTDLFEVVNEHLAKKNVCEVRENKRNR